jgi:hypothetical protein
LGFIREGQYMSFLLTAMNNSRYNCTNNLRSPYRERNCGGVAQFGESNAL